MLAYITRRLVYGLITLFALSLVVFLLIQASGGGPLDRLKLNPRMQPVIAQLTQEWGLDKPVMEQYFTWLRNFVTPADVAAEPGMTVLFGKLGLRSIAPVMLMLAAGAFTVVAAVARPALAWWRSARPFLVIAAWTSALWLARSDVVFALSWGDSFRGDGAVWDNIFGAAGATFRLGIAAMILSLLIGIPLGIYQAIRQYSFFDQVGTAASFVAFSTPIFIVAVGFQLLLALYLEKWTGVKLFFVTGMTDPGYNGLGFLEQMGDIARHLTLPALSIALISIAGYSRFQRASMLEVMHSDYLRTAKAKGLPRRQVIMKHAMRNALIPIITLVSLNVANLIGGAIITERIFGWPGVGRLYIDAINAVDYPTVMAIVMSIGIGVVVMNIVADILYGVLDPRIRYD